MKIKTKIKLCTLALLFTFALASFVLYLATAQVDYYRKKSLILDAHMVASTNLRAAVRNRLLDAYEVVFVRGANGNEEILRTSREAVEQKFRELKQAIELNMPGGALLPNPKTQAEFEAVKRLHEQEYLPLDNALNRIVESAKKRDTKSLNRAFLDARENEFNGKFLPAISRIIAEKNQEMALDAENLDKSIFRFRLLVTVFGTVLFVGGIGILHFAYRLTSKRLALLEKASERIGHGDFSIHVRVTGSDEVSALENAFNRMAQSLEDARSQLQQQQELLVHSSKLSALGEMAGGIAHEINNPLAIIQLHARLLQRLSESERLDLLAVLESADSIQKTVARIGKIVKGLRSFARDGRKDPFELCGLQEIVSDTLDLCREKFKNHGIDLQVVAPPDKLQIECRSTEISQVLLNLLNNAFDAIDALSNKWMRLELRDIGDTLEISVTDSGAGIPQDIRSKILQPFFTTKEIGKGTGLGLSISRGIVQSHNGRLFLDETSKNTRFVVILPKRQNVDSKPGTAEAPPELKNPS